MEYERNQSLSNKLGKAIDIVVSPIQQRMSNPIYGSFTLSWVILNWQPILFFMFSSKSIEDKLKYIKDNFYSGNFLFIDLDWFMYLILPILISILYILGSPRLENMISKINRRPIISRINQLHDDKIEDFNKLKKIAIKEAEVNEAKTEFKSIRDKDIVIEDSKQKISLLTEENEKSNNKIIETTNHLKQLSVENLHSQTLYSNLMNQYDKVIIEFPALLERVFRSIPISDIEQVKSDVMYLVSESTLLTKDLKDKIGESLNAGAAFSQSANPSFILNLDLVKLDNNAINLAIQTSHNLFLVEEILTTDDPLKLKFLVRFKNRNDKFEMFDYLFANLPLIKRVSLSNPEYFKQK